MRVNRNIVKLSFMNEIINDDYVEASAKERIEMVWDITCELWAVATKGAISAESRLQRNVATLTKT